MAKFEVGDKVRCINNEGAPELEKDAIYTVTKDSGSFVSVKEQNGGSGGFYKRRFELDLMVARANSGKSSKVSEEPKFKVGSRVWSPAHGWGEVQLSKEETFPVRVRFDYGGTMFYTSEGKSWKHSPLPTLFLDEVPASNWPNPPAKLDPSTFVVDQYLEAKIFDSGAWILVKFAMLKDGAVWVFSHSYDFKSAETLYKVVDFRLPIAQKGV